MCIKDLSEARELHWRAEKRRRTKSVTGWEGAFKFFTHSHITRTLNFCHVSTLFSFPFDDIISSSFSPGEIKFLQMNCAKNWIGWHSALRYKRKKKKARFNFTAWWRCVFCFYFVPLRSGLTEMNEGASCFVFFNLFLLHSAVVWPKHSQRGDIRVLGWYSKLASVR